MMLSLIGTKGIMKQLFEQGESSQSNLNIIITGIPRSGTSYLCGLLSKTDNSVVINEPNGMSRYMSVEEYPKVVAKYYRDIRLAVLSGEKIENKMHQGKIIEDTSLIQSLEYYSPELFDNNFSICTKNTLGYLSRLDKLKVIMPDTSIFACIRNPIDTIASWKSSFEHLRTVVVANDYIIGSKNDPYLTEWQKEKIVKISEEKDLSRKRAMFWAYLAEWIFINKHELTVISYDDIVLSPVKIVSLILGRVAGERGIVFKEQPEPSKIRNMKRSGLNDADYNAINEFCNPVASRFECLNVSYEDK